MSDSDDAFGANRFIYNGYYGDVLRLDHYPSMTKLAITTDYLDQTHKHDTLIPAALGRMISFALQLIAQAGGRHNEAGVWHIEQALDGLMYQTIRLLLLHISRFYATVEIHTVLACELDKMINRVRRLTVHSSTSEISKIATPGDLVDKLRGFLWKPECFEEFEDDLYTLFRTSDCPSLTNEHISSLVPDYLTFSKIHHNTALDKCPCAVEINDIWLLKQQRGLVLLVNTFLQLAPSSNKLTTWRMLWHEILPSDSMNEHAQ